MIRLRGTWTTERPPNRLRQALGVLLLVLVVAVCLVAPSLRSELTHQPAAQATPSPTPSARRRHVRALQRGLDRNRTNGF
jgi:hypothetical protein